MFRIYRDTAHSILPLKLFWVDEAFKIALSKDSDIPTSQLNSLMKYLLKFDLFSKAIQLCIEDLVLNEPSPEIDRIYQELIENFFLLSKKGSLQLKLNNDDMNSFQKICEMSLDHLQENKNSTNFQFLWKILWLFPSLSNQILWNKSDLHLLFDETLLQEEPYKSIFYFIKLGYVQPSAELFFQLAAWNLEKKKPLVCILI